MSLPPARPTCPTTLSSQMCNTNPNLSSRNYDGNENLNVSYMPLSPRSMLQSLLPARKSPDSTPSRDSHPNGPGFLHSSHSSWPLSLPLPSTMATPSESDSPCEASFCPDTTSGSNKMEFSSSPASFPDKIQHHQSHWCHSCGAQKLNFYVIYFLLFKFVSQYN